MEENKYYRAVQPDGQIFGLAQVNAAGIQYCSDKCVAKFASLEDLAATTGYAVEEIDFEQFISLVPQFEDLHEQHKAHEKVKADAAKAKAKALKHKPEKLSPPKAEEVKKA